ncbi:MAG: glycosyltransferase family 9 protein [Leptolyngbyaceae cyanobacterium SL_1_1]|nr:glycosyltransferase family 9 protein [Leptolyngbyaceae cyanobacterium SL_1_1]
MRVLALVPGGIDDQILFFPTLDDLQQVYPKAEIDVVVEPKSKDAYRVSKVVDETILFDFQASSSPSDWANLLGIIRDREYSIVLSTSQDWSVGLMLWLSGIPIRIGYANPSSGIFLTNSVPFKPAQYQAHLYHDLLQGLDVTGTAPATSLSVPQKDLDWAEQTRESLELKNTGYVVLYGDPNTAPRSQVSRSFYPVESWQAIVADFQRRQPELPLVILQDSTNGLLVNALSELAPAVKVIQPANIGQTAAVLAGADLVICPDGYILQLAVALKVFTLALFGDSTPAKRLPPVSTSDSDEVRFVAITSLSDRVADISAQDVLKRAWGE